MSHRCHCGWVACVWADALVRSFPTRLKAYPLCSSRVAATFISPGRKSGGRWQNDTILFRDDTPFAYMNIFRARFVSGHRLQPCRQRCKIVIPRRNGAISGKPDGPVAVAPHGRVGQYWRQNGTAEAGALTQTSPIIRDLLAGCVWRWTLLSTKMKLSHAP